MTDRIHCLVPFCRRTIAAPLRPGDHEWICHDHWKLVDKKRRSVYARARRRFKPGYVLSTLWAGLKRQAIERALP